MKRARIIEMINKFAFEDYNSVFEDIMSYNDILDYVGREHKNEDGRLWKFSKILSHSLIAGKKGVEDKIEVQMLRKTGATSTKSYETLYRDVHVDLAICAKENDLLEEDGWKKLARLANRPKLIERFVK